MLSPRLCGQTNFSPPVFAAPTCLPLQAPILLSHLASTSSLIKQVNMSVGICGVAPGSGACL